MTRPASPLSIAIIGTALVISAAMLGVHARRKNRNASPDPTTANSPASIPHAPIPSPTERLRILVRETHPIARSHATLALIGQLQPADFPALLGCCRNLHLTAGSPTVQLLLAAWARTDHAAAISYTRTDTAALAVVMEAWSNLSPGSASNALAWLQDAHIADADSTPLFAAILPALNEEDPRRTSALLLEFQPKARSEILRSVASAVTARGATATSDWLGTFQDPECRAQAIAAVISATPPDQAVGWMTRFAPELRNGKSGLNVSALFNTWESRDPGAARAAFEQLPPGTDFHHGALLWLAGSREAQADPVAIHATLQRFPEELDDSVIISLCHAATRRRPGLCRRSYSQPEGAEHRDPHDYPAVV